MDEQEDKSVDVAADSTELVETTDKSDSQLEVAPEATTPPVPPNKPGIKQRFARFIAYYRSHKKVAIPATVVLIIGLLLLVPFTRYALLGTVIKKDYHAVVLDSKTGKPISSVTVTLGGKTATTDQTGMAMFTKVSVGKYQLKATKKYYSDNQASVLVPIGGSTASKELKLDPTGRQVKAKVTNKLTGAGVEGAVVAAADTEAKTDKNGEVTIVLPADKEKQDATISGDGYNKMTASLTISESDTVLDANKLAITPSGKVYFLSKRTGKINVMKSDLDGSNPEVVLAATGNEDDGDTILLAAQDWKYLALKSKRSGADKPASLYLIDTANGDKLTTMDEGAATFTLTGWSGHTFVYQVQRDAIKDWQPNRQSLKSYNAESAKINVLENTSGEGTGAGSYQGTDYKSEYISNVILSGSTVTYTKSWIGGIYLPGGAFLAGKQNNIYSTGVEGQGKKTVKSFDATTSSSIEAKLYEPKEIYFRVYVNDKSEFYALENGTINTKGDLTSTFNSPYPTYLASPSNDKTFWAEARDGKNTLFVGDSNGDNSKTVNELSEYTAYGWFTQDYLLLSKNSSELYIMGVDGLQNGQKPVKITDYHKPNTTFYGYGGGYGGL